VLTVTLTLLIFATLLGIPALASAGHEDEERKAAAKERGLKADEEAEKLAKTLDRLSKSALDRLNEQLAAYRDFNNEQKRTVVEAELLNELRLKQISAGKDLLTQEQEKLAIERDRYEVAESQAAAAERNLEKLKETKDVTDEQLAAAQNLVDLTRKQQEEQAKALGLAEQRAEAEEELSDATAGSLTRFTGLASSFEKTMLGALTKSVEKAGGLTNAFNIMGKQVALQLSPANLFAGALEKVAESTKAMVLQADSAFSSFRRATGGGAEFDDVMMEARVDAAAMGASLQQVSQATTVLFNEMRRFSDLSQDTQTELVAFTATMENMGVSSAATAEFMNFATAGLRMNADQAMAAQRELAAAALEIGMAPQEMMEGFASAAPVIAAHGDASIQVMKGLAAAAKATGAEVSELLGVFGQAMNTFEGTAEVAGRVNAILGGDLLNSVDLLNASEDERIRMMIQSIELSGRSFESMGRFEKQALANAVGITDMATANEILGQSLSAYDTQQQAAQQSALSQAEMEERAKQATSAMDKFNSVIESMAIAVRPILDIMHAFFDVILMIQNFTGGAFVPVIFGLIGAYYALNLITKANIALKRMQLFFIGLQGTGNLFLAATFAKNTAATELDTQISMLNSFAKSRGAVATRVLAIANNALLRSMGKVVLVAGAMFLAFQFLRRLGPVTAAVLTLAAAFAVLNITSMATGKRIGIIVSMAMLLGAAILAPMHSPPLYIGIFILAAGVLALGAAANAVSAGLLVLGVTVVMIGAGAAMMGAGVMMAATGLGFMFSQLKDMDPSILFTLAAGLVALSMAFLTMGLVFAIPFTTLGLIAIASGLTTISLAMRTFSGETLGTFNTLIDRISTLKDMGAVEVSLNAMASGIENMADAINEVPIIKSIVLSTVLGKMVKLSTEVSPAAVQSTKELTEVVQQVAEVKVGFLSLLNVGSAVDNLVKILQAQGGAGAGGAAAGGGGTTVVLELDGRQLGRTVVDLVNERYNLDLSR